METTTTKVNIPGPTEVRHSDFRAFSATSVKHGRVYAEFHANQDGTVAASIAHVHDVKDVSLSSESQYGGVRVNITLHDGQTFTVVTYPH
jgi:hypothetical protein